MARRSDHSREELEALAIRHGLKIIVKQGFLGFSTRKVAAAMGYTVGTLYHVFGSLDDYITRINATLLDEWYEDLQAALRRNPRNPVRALASAYIRFVRQHYHRWELLFAYRFAKGRKTPAWYAEKVKRLFTVAESVFLPCVNGDAKRAERAAKLLWTGVHGICVLSFSGKLDVVGAESAETLAAALVEVLLKGFAAE